MVWWVCLHDRIDPDYECIYTVWADDATAAGAFAEEHNPGRVCVNVWQA